MVREASAMGRAAGTNAAGGQPDMLDELRFHWGSAYDISATRGVYTARRRDGTGQVLTRASADGLALALRISHGRAGR
jgi:hypothetical protein